MEIKEKDVEDVYRGVFVVNSLTLNDGAVKYRAVFRPSSIMVETVGDHIPYRIVSYSMVYWDQQPEDEEQMKHGTVFHASPTRAARLRQGTGAECRSVFTVRIKRENFTIEQLEDIVIDHFLTQILDPSKRAYTVAPSSTTLRTQSKRLSRYDGVIVTDVFHTSVYESTSGQNLKLVHDKVQFRLTVADGPTIDYHPENRNDYLEYDLALDTEKDLAKVCRDLFYQKEL